MTFTSFGSENYNKFKSTYVKDNLDVSGNIIIRPGSKFYINNLNSYDISGTLNINNYKNIYFNNSVDVYIKSINVYDRLAQVLINSASINSINSQISTINTNISTNTTNIATNTASINTINNNITALINKTDFGHLTIQNLEIDNDNIINTLSYIDMKTFNSDYDVRILQNNGNANTVGQGQLNFECSLFNVTSNIVANGLNLNDNINNINNILDTNFFIDVSNNLLFSSNSIAVTNNLINGGTIGIGDSLLIGNSITSSNINVGNKLKCNKIVSNDITCNNNFYYKYQICGNILTSLNLNIPLMNSISNTVTCYTNLNLQSILLLDGNDCAIFLLPKYKIIFYSSDTILNIIDNTIGTTILYQLITFNYSLLCNRIIIQYNNISI